MKRVSRVIVNSYRDLWYGTYTMTKTTVETDIFLTRCFRHVAQPNGGLIRVSYLRACCVLHEHLLRLVG